MRELIRYVGNGYRIINFGLRNGTITAIDNRVRTLDRELENNGSPLPGGTTLYRIAGPVADYAAFALPNTAFSDAAYLSTSRNEATCGWTGQHGKRNDTLFMTINCMPLGYGRYIGEACPNKQEMEGLFHRNVNFLITARATDGRGNIHWTMDEVASPNAGYVWGSGG